MGDFVNNHIAVFILAAVLPISLIRIVWNIITYNEINGTGYIPLFQNWQKGGNSVNMYCTFIFWWTLKDSDSITIKQCKKIAKRVKRKRI